MKDEQFPLKVYDASAGSGKTFRLVLEYLTLVLRKEQPATFDQIVAMTFTNKASYEMKERIVGALEELTYNISNSKISALLRVQLNMDEIELQTKAQEVLLSILHNYEDFNVLTIDKFNLRLIKSFSKDLDLPSDFEIVMNEEELIERIVDRLLERLGKEGNEELDEIVYKYAEQNLDEEDKWNFRKSLIDFGKVLKKEKDLEKIHEVMNMDLSLDSFKLLKAEKTSIEQNYKNIQRRLQGLLSQFPLDPSRIKYKTRTIGSIEKVSTKPFPKEDCLSPTLREYCENEPGETEYFPLEIRQALLELDNYWQIHERRYFGLALYFKNFFNMCLLKHISEEIDISRIEERKIRISEFNQLISKLIREEKAVFIYERLGTRFHHFLLDEFQDTSHLQWMNLVPLLHESLSWNYENLIVGDPKQSIYRFKNGVAEQFVALPGIYNPTGNEDIAIESSYFKSRGIKEPLVTNWRSAKNIVEFNNTFFNVLRNSMPEHTRSFYSSISQTPSSEVNGKIKINSELKEAITNEDLIVDIISVIEDALGYGYTPGDICILGDTNKQCNIWARGLAAAKYKVVSADSLLIQSSTVVQLGVAYFKVVLHRQDQHQMKHFAELYFRSFEHAGNTKYFDYILQDPDNIKKRLFDTETFINQEFGGEKQFYPPFENLYQLIIHLFQLISLDELSDPFAHRFADYIHQYELKNGPDLNGFLEEYESKKSSLALEIPESTDALQIMTIHKSKGLEFPVVILPSMAFNKKRMSEQMVKVGDHMIYKKPTMNEKFGELQSAYHEEIDQVFTDCVNKCYVALTRPIDRLYIFNYYKKGTFGEDFHEALKEIPNCKTQDNLIEYKEDSNKEILEQLNNEEFFNPTSLKDFLWFPDIALQDKDELNAPEYFNQQQIFGRQFHYLISRIQDPEQIDNSIKTGLQEGVIDVNMQDELRSQLNATFQNRSYALLFNEAVEILHEQSILVDVDKDLRPDLIIVKKSETIVVDYKTGSKKQKDIIQVSEYVQVLREMNYPDVKGFLYYTQELRLEPVGV